MRAPPYTKKGIRPAFETVEPKIIFPLLLLLLLLLFQFHVLHLLIGNRFNINSSSYKIKTVSPTIIVL